MTRQSRNIFTEQSFHATSQLLSLHAGMQTVVSVEYHALVLIVHTSGRTSPFRGLGTASILRPIPLNATTTRKVHTTTERCFSVKCAQEISIVSRLMDKISMVPRQGTTVCMGKLQMEANSTILRLSCTSQMLLSLVLSSFTKRMESIILFPGERY